MFPLSGQQISDVLKVPVASVNQTWPALESALNKYNIYSDLVAIASIATVRVECGNKFLPIHEFGTPQYFTRMYDINGQNPQLATRLGNLEPGDGIKYAGRGYVQLTGKANYQHFGILLGIDLSGTPDLALQPDIAAEVFALYFKQHKTYVSANAQNWEQVRRSVNGGLNGFDVFITAVTQLQNALAAS